MREDLWINERRAGFKEPRPGEVSRCFGQAWCHIGRHIQQQRRVFWPKDQYCLAVVAWLPNLYPPFQDPMVQGTLHSLFDDLLAPKACSWIPHELKERGHSQRHAEEAQVRKDIKQRIDWSDSRGRGGLLNLYQISRDQ